MTIIRGNLKGMDLSGLSQKEQFQLAVFYTAWNKPQPELMSRKYWKQEYTDDGYQLQGQVNISDICEEVGMDYANEIDDREAAYEQEQEEQDKQKHSDVTMPDDMEHISSV